MREGKCCLVMHVRSVMYTLLSQLSILFYISLSFPLSLFFHFQITILIPLGTVFSTPLLMFLSVLSSFSLCSLILVAIPFLMIVVCSIFMGAVPFIPKINPK